MKHQVSSSGFRENLIRLMEGSQYQYLIPAYCRIGIKKSSESIGL
ncbi:hypothetical protein CCACVL1_24781 [Corchorus capsularis]|uniref:Uncharacterized protein n=1 Tax=Corchorus capsularis TaxID=210143 RepID=A0A1R3GNB0_COCAP|nr:hypothetical protein CCACVL1_24781 [Corchorus capsularis]